MSLFLIKNTIENASEVAATCNSYNTQCH